MTIREFIKTLITEPYIKITVTIGVWTSDAKFALEYCHSWRLDTPMSRFIYQNNDYIIY